jgi:hypothetical protein
MATTRAYFKNIFAHFTWTLTSHYKTVFSDSDGKIIFLFKPHFRESEAAAVLLLSCFSLKLVLFS